MKRVWPTRKRGTDGDNGARLVMTLLVRDESDIIRDNLDYHLSRGVDFVIATDNGSVDDTPAILEAYQRAGVLRLVREPGNTHSQGRWVTRMARLAYSDHGADWVINNDADEFWWADGGDLKQALEQCAVTSELVRARRFDMVAKVQGGAPYLERMLWRDLESVNAVGDPLPPKALHRAHPDVRVAEGNHSAAFGDRKPQVGAEKSLMIFHYPDRGYEQYSGKIARGGAALARNTDLSQQAGHAWRAMYAMYQAGTLEEHYLARASDPVSVEAGVRAGRYVPDTRLRDYMRELRKDHEA